MFIKTVKWDWDIVQSLQMLFHGSIEGQDVIDVHYIYTQDETIEIKLWKES